MTPPEDPRAASLIACMQEDKTMGGLLDEIERLHQEATQPAASGRQVWDLVSTIRARLPVLLALARRAQSLDAAPTEEELEDVSGAVESAMGDAFDASEMSGSAAEWEISGLASFRVARAAIAAWRRK